MIKILEAIRLWIRIQEFLEGFVNIARLGIFPQFGSHLWENWSDLRENFIIDESFKQDKPH